MSFLIVLNAPRHRAWRREFADAFLGGCVANCLREVCSGNGVAEAGRVIADNVGGLLAIYMFFFNIYIYVYIYIYIRLAPTWLLPVT